MGITGRTEVYFNIISAQTNSFFNCSYAIFGFYQVASAMGNHDKAILTFGKRTKVRCPNVIKAKQLNTSIRKLDLLFIS